MTQALFDDTLEVFRKKGDDPDVHVVVTGAGSSVALS